MSFLESAELVQLAAEIGAARGYKKTSNIASRKLCKSNKTAFSQASNRPDSALEVITLATSSKGNASLVRTERTAVLVDAGISARKIVQGLSRVGVVPEDISAICLTHEHSDHVAGLATLLKQWQLPVYTSRKTWNALGEIGAAYERCHREWDGEIEVGDLRIDRFTTSHDAADPCGYTFCTTRYKAAVCTDLGFVTSTVMEALRDTDLLVLEANHDLAALRQGPYPLHLKERILGSRGHLCNIESARLVTRLYRQKPLQIILGHRSETNNTMALVEQTMKVILKEQDLSAETQIQWQHGQVLGNVRMGVGEIS